MAIYDKSADANTAVTAFLSQFTVSANGDIRFSSGTDTFHTWWIHRALQKIAWDFTISGDDQINLSKPNPSTSEALGTIITLLDHTTAYSVNYNITSVEAQYMFGGSIEQNGGDDRFSGMIVLGTTASATQLQLIQNNTLLASHWGTGKNQTDSNTLLRILVQTISGGVITDGGRIIVKANEWGDTFAVWRTTLGLGESVASITTSADPQNTTPLLTVEAYTGISNLEGYVTLDVGDGSGLKPYLSEWTYGANNKKALYEFVKSILVRGTTETIYGIDGDLFTGGATFSTTLTAGAGGELWVQNEVVSWTEAGTASTGIMMAVDDPSDDTATEMWIHILTGINPTAGTTISGAVASQDADVVSSLIPSPSHLGVFTGSWIGDFGIGFAVAELTQSDSVKPLDGTGPLSPPNNVPVSVTVNGTANSHVILAIKDPVLGGIDETQYTLASGNNLGNGTLVISEAIASDTPPTGWVLVKEGTTFEPIEYASWAGSTFTLVGTLSANLTAGKDSIVPFFYDNVPSDGGTIATSLIYNADIDVVGWVRHGDAGNAHKPVPIAGAIGTAGLSLSVNMESE